MATIDSIIFKHFQQFEEAFELRRKIRFDDAIIEYDRILSEAEENIDGVKDHHQYEYVLGQIKSMAHSYKGDSHRAAARPEQAIPEFSAALDLAKDPFIRAIALEFKGIYETQLGDKKQAVRDNKEALKLYTEVGHLEKMARMNSVLGSSYLVTGEYGLAERCFQEVLTITADILDRFERGDPECSKFYKERKAWANRADALQRGAENLTLKGLKLENPEERNNLYRTAVNMLEDAIKISTKLDDKGTVAVEHGRMAYTLSLLDDETGCCDSYNKYIEGVNRNLMQPITVKVMQPYLDHVEEYLTEKAHAKSELEHLEPFFEPEPTKSSD